MSQNLEFESAVTVSTEVSALAPSQLQPEKSINHNSEPVPNTAENLSLTHSRDSNRADLDVIELQLKLSNELLEKYQLQEEMIRLRQQLREQQTKSIDTNIVKINEFNQQKLENRHPEPTVSLNASATVTSLPQSSSQTENPTKIADNDSHCDYSLPETNESSVTPSPPPKRNASRRKPLEKRSRSPEVYVDLGVPYLVPKGMSFQHLKSNVSVKLVGHVPKSPSKPLPSEEASPTKKPIQTKRKKANNTPGKDIETPSKSPPSKKRPQSKKQPSAELKSIGYSLFCESIREDAEKIILDSKPSGKGKKKCSPNELEELFSKMWGVLNKKEKEEWEKKSEKNPENYTEDEDIVALSTEEIFKSTTMTTKEKKKKLTTKTQKQTKATKKEIVEETHEKQTRKKKVIPDPAEELFDRVENTSLSSISLFLDLF